MKLKNKLILVDIKNKLFSQLKKEPNELADLIKDNIDEDIANLIINHPGQESLIKQEEIKIMGSGVRILGDVIDIDGQNVIEFNLLDSHK